MAPAVSRRALRTPPRATRAKPAFSYAEPSSDSDLDEGGEEIPPETHISSDALLATPSRQGIKSRTSAKRRQRRAASFYSDDERADELPSKKHRHSKPSTPKSIAAESDKVFKTTGVIPPWQSLPYHILVQIFQYATYPLYDDHTFQPLPSGSRLLKIARLCKAFAEPAFTVLYASPPLVPMDKAHNLVELLKADPTSKAFKYRQKVVSLRIDVGQVAAYSLPGSGHLDLHGLIRNLPRLVDLEFYHQKDMSPYRNLDDTIKWSYPENLLDALEHVDPDADVLRGDKTSVCRLRSWRWSSRLAGKKYPIEKIQEIHLKPSFAGLRKVAFVNYQIPYVRKGDDDPQKHESFLAESLSALKNLEHLVFESSTLVNSNLLPLLPTNLRNLELINCWEILSDDFSEFLLTHGNQLRCLTLNHNQSLSLSFLPTLGIACPKLQVLRMNLTYFNVHVTYRDMEPLYDQLLLPEQVPTWPTTLQTIELTQLRKWETEAAEMFFQSLLDSAATLPDLRRLTIQAILNIGWRDRASFRDKWVGSLDRVFKRVSSQPQTISSLRTHETAILCSSQIKQGLDQHSQEVEGPKRRSLRSSSGSSSTGHTLSCLPSVAQEVHKTNQAPSTPSRRSTRISTQQNRTGRYAESPDNSDTENPESDGRFARGLALNSHVSRDLAIVKKINCTDKTDLPSSPPQTPIGDEDSSDGTPFVRRNNGKAKDKEVMQGMCEIVDIRIDNLRPRETQVTEADFLDEEAPGDGDWNGDDDGIEDEYAW